MKSYDVVIIGGGPSGIVTAVTTRKQHPEKTILVKAAENAIAQNSLC